MRTDDLIAQLSTGLEPVKTGSVPRILLLAIAVGAIASAALVLSWLGPRHDLASAAAGFSLWMKVTYTLAIAALGFWVVERAGRPGADMSRPMLVLALPVLAIALLATVQMSAPGADIQALMLGRSFKVCATNILLVATPTLLAVFWALRRLAPTRLGQAGAAAGLLAGAVGASVYAFHCPEASAPFVALWYTAGMALTAGFGGFLGRYLLRW